MIYIVNWWLTHSKIKREKKAKNDKIENSNQNITNQLNNKVNRLPSSEKTSATTAITNLLGKDLSKSKKLLDKEKSTSLSRSATKKSKLIGSSSAKKPKNDLQNNSFDSSLDLKYSSRSSKSYPFLFKIYIEFLNA